MGAYTPFLWIFLPVLGAVVAAVVVVRYAASQLGPRQGSNPLVRGALVVSLVSVVGAFFPTVMTPWVARWLGCGVIVSCLGVVATLLVRRPKEVLLDLGIDRRSLGFGCVAAFVGVFELVSAMPAIPWVRMGTYFALAAMFFSDRPALTKNGPWLYGSTVPWSDIEWRARVGAEGRHLALGLRRRSWLLGSLVTLTVPTLMSDDIEHLMRDNAPGAVTNRALTAPGLRRSVYVPVLTLLFVIALGAVLAPPMIIGALVWQRIHTNLFAHIDLSRLGGGTVHDQPPYNARVASDVTAAARAQAIYFAAHQSYFSGPCNALPDFTPSDGTLCSTLGTTTDFTVRATHASATVTCVWTHHPDAGSPYLTCS